MRAGNTPMSCALDLPEQWRRLAGDLSRRSAPAAIYIVGGPDNGKSTLAGYLYHRLAEEGKSVEYIDLDPGQSRIGPPTTVGLAGRRQMEALRFVGSTSPPGSFLQHAASASALRRLHAGNRWSVIDACGFAEGPAAEEFQYRLLDLLRPEITVRLGENPSIRRSSGPFEGSEKMEMRDLPVSAAAVSVSAQSRMRNRLKRYAEYFRHARGAVLDLSGIPLRGKVPDLSPGSSAGGIVCAFCDAEQWVMALGIVSSIDPAGRLRYVAPPFARERPAVLQFGSLRLLPQEGRLAEC